MFYRLYTKFPSMLHFMIFSSYIFVRVGAFSTLKFYFMQAIKMLTTDAPLLLYEREVSP